MPIARTLPVAHAHARFAASSLTIFDCLHRYIVDALFFFTKVNVFHQDQIRHFSQKKIEAYKKTSKTIRKNKQTQTHASTDLPS